jgi:hypothetical protein
MVEEVGSETTTAPGGVAEYRYLDRDGNPIDMVALKADYHTVGMTMVAITIKYNISMRTLNLIRKFEGWQMRHDRAGGSRRRLIGRLFTLLEGQIAKLERKMKTSTDIDGGLIGNLVRDLDKLVSLEKAETPPPEAKREPRDMAEKRKKIARRIDELLQR